MKNKRLNPGAIVKIPIDKDTFTYARILDDHDYAIYNCRTSNQIADLNIIIQSPILFVARVDNFAILKGRWTVVGTIELDNRHKIVPKYFDPDLTNPELYGEYFKKYEEVEKYFTYEIGGLQDGGMHSAEHIENRLHDYYYGYPDRYIVSELNTLKKLLQFEKSKKNESS
jgi:hypothetical protein